MMYSVKITSESAPKERAHWSLSGLDDKEFVLLEDARQYKVALESRETEDEKNDFYYQKFGPLIKIFKVIETDDRTIFDEVE